MLLRVEEEKGKHMFFMNWHEPNKGRFVSQMGISYNYLRGEFAQYCLNKIKSHELEVEQREPVKRKL